MQFEQDEISYPLILNSSDLSSSILLWNSEASNLFLCWVPTLQTRGSDNPKRSKCQSWALVYLLGFLWFYAFILGNTFFICIGYQHTKLKRKMMTFIQIHLTCFLKAWTYLHKFLGITPGCNVLEFFRYNVSLSVRIVLRTSQGASQKTRRYRKYVIS